MQMIVVGCGRVGAELAQRLFQNGHSVVIIDQTESAFQNLKADFRGRTVVGEALSQDVLRRAGIEEADGLAAVTSNDTVNAVVAHIARSVYNLPTVVVRNFDSRYLPMLQTFGFQVVSSSSWGAQRIEELLYHQSMHTVFSAGNGEVEVYEFTVPEVCEGHTLGNLLPNESCIAIALTRAGQAELPRPDLKLMKGDVVLVGATLSGSQTLRQRIETFLDNQKRGEEIKCL